MNATCPTCNQPTVLHGYATACDCGREKERTVSEWQKQLEAIDNAPDLPLLKPLRGPFCKQCGASMIHTRISGYRCGRDRFHEGIVWPQDRSVGE